ncbi:MAG: N-acetylmuramic acid 6-phosphate etherase [Phycisphaeraceae bacterium]|nr:N-acetylmuramic acid 6-phosphate etherase [Phycisphaeraceae bacterium]
MSTDLPNRGHLATEQRNTQSAALDAVSIGDALRLLNNQDAMIPAAVGAAIPAIARLVEDVVAAFERGGRLIYFGAGTSGRLGVLDASECPPTFHTDPSMVVGIIAGGDSALRNSSEGAEDDPNGARAEIEKLKIGPDDVVVGIAAGGTTPYVWGAIRLAKGRGARTGMICCVKLDGEISGRVADTHPHHVVELLVGPEAVTGSTRMKAGTATKLALNMITTVAMVRLGKVWGNLMVDLRATNAKLVDRAARIIAGQTSLTREDALTLLEKAGGSVKLALVMARREVDRAAAEQLLSANDGQLRKILGPPR